MQRPLTVLLVASLVLAGCGWRDSRLNPGNWFGKSRSEAIEPAQPDPVNPLLPKKNGKGMFARPDPEDLSVPIYTVSKLEVEPTNTGAIIYAEGVAQRQGPYDVELRDISTAEEEAEGVLSLSYRVVYPRKATPQGSEYSRTVRAALSMSKQQLSRIKTIRVSGETNQQVTRRR
ncbi:hypothetical protein [Pseudodonghicola flavimaris]|uniref:Lipoprotein n=1 Tax=Pseudodonghicola flavimaris TaxID=3050036 RepID=A0ABT7F187_9RHOB|nr:hypothetical protein [Pseudodonghicola flavimaris]MDK3018366.1 hypothetical protein [Pseudodonghicola flavimaris]